MLYAMILPVAILLWLLYEWAEHTLIEYNTTKVECKKSVLQKQVRLCLITDLHNNRKNIKKISAALKKYAPDAILLAGDMINKHQENQHHALELMQELVRIAPVYYSYGNHEERMRTEKPELWSEYINRLPNGVILLDNFGVTASFGDISCFISGLSLSEPFYKKGSLYQGKEELPEILVPEGVLHIMLAHHPEYAKWYGNYQPDLVVSGHLHGGLMRLPGIGGVLSPRLHLPKEDAGLYPYSYGKLFVSRGIGSHTIPLRFFNRAEINYLILYNEKENENGE